jgi:hypothetical protein
MGDVLFFVSKENILKSVVPGQWSHKMHFTEGKISSLFFLPERGGLFIALLSRQVAGSYSQSFLSILVCLKTNIL